MHPAAIALGSNLGDREANLRTAMTRIAQLPTTIVVAASPFVDTAPVVPAGAAGASGGRYLNGVVLIHTQVEPRALLTHLLGIERDLGRVRNPTNRWGPRTIDLDILLYDDLIIDEPGLVIPHPRLHQRRFVLDPLAAVAPDWIVPTLGRSVAELRDALPPPCPDGPANNQE